MDQKFSLLEKPGCRYATLLIVFMGRYAAACTLLPPIQFLNLGLYSIRSVTISGPHVRFLMDWRRLVGISFVGIKRIMPYRSSYVTYIQGPVLFHDSPVLQGGHQR
jgi:hypothetical protein